LACCLAPRYLASAGVKVGERKEVPTSLKFRAKDDFEAMFKANEAVYGRASSASRRGHQGRTPNRSVHQK